MSKLNEKPSSHLTASETVDVEAIMAQVRAKVQQNRQAALAQGLQPRQFVFADFPEEPTSGSYDADLYAQLRQVNRPQKVLWIRRAMRSSFLTKLPLVGSIWQRIQFEAHGLVIFYVGSLAEELVAFQRPVARVLNRLVSWRQEKDAEIKLLQEEIKVLKERLDWLEDRK